MYDVLQITMIFFEMNGVLSREKRGFIESKPTSDSSMWYRDGTVKNQRRTK